MKHVYDLDGVIRICREPWASLRDNAKLGLVRFIAGQIAALTAKTFFTPNSHFIITNSPTNENLATKIWGLLNGMNLKIVSNPYSNRLFESTKPNDKMGGYWKNSILLYLRNYYKVQIFLDDNNNQAKLIKVKGVNVILI